MGRDTGLSTIAFEGIEKNKKDDGNLFGASTLFFKPLRVTDGKEERDTLGKSRHPVAV